MTSIIQTDRAILSLDDSQLKGRQDAPRPPRLRGLFFMDKFCHRETSANTEGTEDSGDFGHELDVATTTGAIPLTSMDSSIRIPSKASNEESAKVVEAEAVTNTEGECCCAICLGDYQLGDRVRVLLCEHEYHAECIGKRLCLHYLETIGMVFRRSS